MVPCDGGGLQACPYWRTHENSPGVRPDPEESRAIDLYHETKRLGWPLVESLRTIRLTTAEAEALLVRFEWLDKELPGILEEFYAE